MLFQAFDTPKIGVVEPRDAQNGIFENRTLEVGARQIGAFDPRVAQIGVLQ